MALSSLRRMTPPEQPIQPLEEDPEFTRIVALRRSLFAARDERQRGLDLLGIQGVLAGGTVSPTQRAQLRERADKLAATAAQPAEPISDDGLPPAVAQALALLRGETVTEPPDREAKFKRLRSEHKIINDALNVAENMLDAIRADRSHEVALRLQPQHREILRTVYTTALAFSAAIAAERSLYATPLVAGYSERPDILNRPALSSAHRLGSTAEYDAEISSFGRRLAALGVI